MGTTPPSLMTAQQRMEETANILALGIVRLWKRQGYCLDSQAVSRMYHPDGQQEEPAPD